MYKYEVVMKDGMVEQVESLYTDLLTVNSMMNDHLPFVRIGDVVFNKDAVAFIRKKTEDEV